MQLERLEARRPLAFDAVDLGVLKAGLVNEYLPFLEVAGNNDHYRDELPMVGAASLGTTYLNGITSRDVFPLKSIVDGLLATPFTQYASQSPNASDTQVVNWFKNIRGRGVPSALNTSINGLEIISSDAISKQTPTDNTFEVILKLRRTTPVGIRVQSNSQASNSDPFQLDIDASQLGSTKLVSDLDLVLRFGVTDGATSEFFVEDSPSREVFMQHHIYAPSLAAQATVQGSIGFVSVDVAFPKSSLTSYWATLSDNWDQADSTSPSRWIGQTLKEDSLGSIASFTTNTIDASSSFQATITPKVLRGVSPQPLRVDTSITSSTPTVTISQGDFGAITKYSKVNADNIAFGLQSMILAIAKAPRLTSDINNPWQSEIALIGKSWNDLIGLEEILVASFIEPVKPKYDSITGELQSRSFVNDYQLQNKLPGLSIQSYDAAGIVFSIERSTPFDVESKIQFSYEGHPDLEIPQPVRVPFELKSNLKFGVRASDGLFYIFDDRGPGSVPEIRITPRTTSIQVGATQPEKARLGISTATIDSGHIELRNLSAAIDLVDPDSLNSPGQILLSDFENRSGETDPGQIYARTSTTTASGAIGAAFTVSTPAPMSATGHVSVDFGGWRAVSSIQPTTTIDSNLLRSINGLKASDFLVGLRQLPEAYRRLLGAQGLGADVPILGGSLGQLVNFQSRITNAVANIESKNLATIQAVQQYLNTQLGANSVLIDASDANSLRLQVNLTQSLVGKTFTASFGSLIDVLGTPLAVQASGRSMLTGGVANSSVTIGINYAPGDVMNRFFVDARSNVSRASVSELSIAQPWTSATVQLGLNGQAVDRIEASISNGTMNAMLQEPNGDGKITLEEMSNSISNFASGTSGGSANLKIVLPAIGSTTPTISSTWVTWKHSSAQTTPSSLESLLASASSFSDTTARQGIAAIQNMLTQWISQPAAQTRILGIGKSFAELFPDLQTLVARFSKILSGSMNSYVAMNQNIVASALSAVVHGSIFDITPIAGQNLPLQERLKYSVRFNAKAIGTSINLSDLGINFLGSTALQLNLEAKALFNFGIDRQNGFYIEAPADPFVLQASLALGPGNNLERLAATFGPVTIGVNGRLDIGANLQATIRDPNNDGRISTQELRDRLSSVMNFSVTGGADAKLAIGGYVGGSSGPGFSTSFEAHWNALSNELTYGAGRGRSIEDGFSGVQFSAGEFIKKSVGEFLTKVEKYNPIPEDVSDFLTSKIDIIEKTPLELMHAAFDVPEWVGMLVDTSSLITKVRNLTAEYVDVGAFLGGAAPASRSMAETLTGNDAVDSLLQELKRYGVRLPIVETPRQSIVSLLLNRPQTVDLITWETPTYSPNKSITILPSTPVFSTGLITVLVGVDGNIGFDAKLKLGIDASGIAPGKNLIDGFFIDNNVTHVGVHAGLSLRIDGSVAGIFGVYGKAGIQGTIQAKPNDLQIVRPADGPPLLATCGGGDGKTHLSELSEIIDNYGIEDTFKLTGSIDITGEFGIKALLWDFAITSGSYPIVKFGDTCGEKTIEDGILVTIVGQQVLYQQSGNDSIVFEVVPRDGGIDFIQTNGNQIIRDHRTAAQLTNVRSLIIATNDGNDTILIDPELTSDFALETISIKSGAGKDNIRVRQNANASHLQSTYIDAGSGDDRIVATFARDVIIGGYGSDNINAGEGDNVVYGDLEEVLDTQGYYGHSADVLFGGNDIVKAGSGKDQIFGGFGNDSLDGGDGENIIAGGWGSDRIISGNGGGMIWGGYKDDGRHKTASFDRGDDSIFVGIGSYTIIAGSGDDEITAFGASDGAAVGPFLSGGDGNDTLRVTHGKAIIRGGAGNDRIESSFGDDSIEGNEGNDSIYDAGGNNIIYGGHDNFPIGGPSDDDVIVVDSGNNTIYGNDGNDWIATGAGNDTIYGGQGNDTIHPGDGTNIIVGGGGDDFIGAIDWRSNGNNTIWSDNTPNNVVHDGNDTIYVGDGDNVIYGGYGNDNITAGSGNNEIYGDYEIETAGSGGNDNIYASSDRLGSRLKVVGGGGSDFIASASWNAILYGGGGGDTFVVYDPGPGTIVYGDYGDELDITSGGDDTILVVDRRGLFAAPSEVVVHAGSGTDRITTTNVAKVTLFGGVGPDMITVEGTLQSAVVYGDELFENVRDGNDTINVNSKYAEIGGGGGDDNITANVANGFDIRGGSGLDRITVTSNQSSNIGSVYGDRGPSVNANDGTDRITVYGPAKVWGTGGNDVISIINSVGGNSEVYGGIGNDEITISGGSINYVDGGDGNDLVQTTTGIDTVYGGEGDDDISTGFNTDTVYGGSGNDTIRGGVGDDILIGQDGNDTIYGEEGNDHIDGGAGDDRLWGNAGDDLIVGQIGDDWIVGGDGKDLLDGGDGDDIIIGDTASLTLSPLIAGYYVVQVQPGGDDDELLGGNGRDRLYGGGGRDRLIGNAGNDTLYGDDGDDELFGSEGLDTLYGGAGNDTLHGEADDDQLYGQSGDDTLWGGSGNDLLQGDQGNDLLYGESGTDSLQGGDGNDLLFGGTDNDSLFGGNGDDTLYAGAGDDTLDGGSGQDYIDSGDGDDIATGGDGDDQLYGGRGNDILSGGLGNDLLDGQEGRDTLFGDDGNDTLKAGTGLGDRLEGGAGDDLLLGSDDSSLTAGLFTGDVLLGGPGNDRIFGRGGADTIDGGDGDDMIDSGAGADIVSGGSGNDDIYAGSESTFQAIGDTIDGGSGDDTILGSNEANDILRGGDGNDKINGQAGDDLIEGQEGNDYLDGGLGSDTIFGGLGDDEIHGGGGSGDVLNGGDGNDIIHGSSDGADLILGGSGRDRIYGYAGNDQIDGGDDDDTIDGGDGDDRIYGGRGSDFILGGADHDVIYGHRIDSSDDDNSVDYLYGDFGTDGNEARSGADRLYGQGGNDVLFGEGGDDFIDPGAGAGNQVDYGTGESTNPNDFVTPTPSQNPPLQDRAAIQRATVSLPTTQDISSIWYEPAGSGSNRGYTNSPLDVAGARYVITPQGITYSTWVDSRNGSAEIYVARQVPNSLASSTQPAGWSELAGSASGAGISGSNQTSSQPSIALASDSQPVVAWVEANPTDASQSYIRVAKFNPAANNAVGAWESISVASSPFGQSSTSKATKPQLLSTSQGIALVWIDASGVYSKLFAAQWINGNWVALGGPSAIQDGGISGSEGSTIDFNAVVNGNKVLVTWVQEIAAARILSAIQYQDGNWQTLGGSTQVHFSNNVQEAIAAYVNNQPVIVWVDRTEGIDRLNAQQFQSTWQPVGASSSYSIRSTSGRFTNPSIAINPSGNSSELVVAATENTVLANGSATNRIAVWRWNGVAFQENPYVVTFDTNTVLQDRRDLQLRFNSLGGLTVGYSAIESGVRQAYYVQLLQNSSGQAYVADANTSVQYIIDTYSPKPGDSIYINGDVSGFTLPVSASGVSIIGRPGARVNGDIHVNASGILLEQMNVEGTITFNQANLARISRATVAGGMTIRGGFSMQLTHSQVRGVGIDIGGGNQDSLFARNIIAGTSDSFRLIGTVSGIRLIENLIAGQTGIRINAASEGVIADNSIRSTNTGISIDQSFAGSIHGNDIASAAVGVFYGAGAPLNQNKLHNNLIGLRASVSGANGLGSYTDSSENEIYNNLTGVVLDGTMVRQWIHHNSVGIGGSGALIASASDEANRIEYNATGVAINGSVRFNQLIGNGIGIEARSGQTIEHNVIAESVTEGIRIAGQTNIRVLNNTIVSPSGNMVSLVNAASNVEIQNNVMWAENGYDIFVAYDSSYGFFSDYNLLHTSGTGKLVYWFEDYTDILDWQENVYVYDLHSRGRTEVNPNWSQPRFVSRVQGNYVIEDVVSQQRFTSPSVDAGNSLIDMNVSNDPYHNLLVNPSFEANLDGWTVTPNASIRTTNPSPYHGAKYFGASINAVTTISQTISIANAGVPTNQNVWIFGARVRFVEETPSDVAEAKLEFLNATGNVIGQKSERSLGIYDRWAQVGGRIQAPAGTISVRLTFTSTLRSGASNDVYIDGAFLYAIENNAAPDIGNSATPAEDRSAAKPRIALRSPDLYRDWGQDKLIPIYWETYANDNRSPVRVDLYRDTPDGPQWLLNIAPNAPDTGRYDWMPSSSGISAGTYGLRIRVTLVNRSIAFDQSSEPFTVPEISDNFYVNDQSLSNDAFTTGIGRNRNTGKLASAPKPLPTTILRNYTLSGQSTLYIDSGSYNLPTRLVYGIVTDVSDDEGFSIVSSAANPAELRITNPLLNVPLIELVEADLVSISNLVLSGGLYGVLARSGSDDLTLRNINVTKSRLDGIRVDATSSIKEFDRVVAVSNLGNGITSLGSSGWIHDTRASNNGGNGLQVVNNGVFRVERSQFNNNSGHGIDASNSGSQEGSIGAQDSSQSNGNRVFDNRGSGIRVNGTVMVGGNTIYGHSTANTYALLASGNSRVASNVVFDNANGISIAGTGSATNNRVFHNTGTGILAEGTNDLFANVVYSNDIGVSLGTSYQASLENNLIYANSSIALFDRGNGASNRIRKNNTIYQPSGNAVVLGPSLVGASYRNNIIVVGSGQAMVVPSTSQAGFYSDYNLYYLIGSGTLGRWQDRDRLTLNDWQIASSTDRNSLYGDPLFVDVVGADNQLGYVNATNLGNDDDFHLMSQYGSFHRGSLAPAVTLASGIFTLPTVLASTVTYDPVGSPGTDRGSPTDSFANESNPNGGFIDIGAYGNTNQTSRSAAEYVTILSPAASQIWPAGQVIPIRWRSHDSLGTVKIELLSNGVVTQTIADSVANSGSFDWLVPISQAVAPNYIIRLTRQSGMNATGVTQGPFAIVAPVSVYYVNDSAVSVGDWTTAVGNNSNDGLSPSTPKATIQAILDQYSLGPGSVIRVDAGNYTLTSNLLISGSDAGVTIEGFYDVAQPTKFVTIDRANTSNGSYAVQLNNADNITLSRLRITGGQHGIYANSTSDSDGVTIRDSWIYNNSFVGVNLDTTNDNVSLIGNTIFGSRLSTSNFTQSQGANLLGQQVNVVDNTFSDALGFGLQATGSGSIARNRFVNNETGISISGTGVIVVDSNLISGNRAYGISVGSGSNHRITNNSVYGNLGSAGYGIRGGSSTISGNNVYDNLIGIDTTGGTTNNNRVYGNLIKGIVTKGGAVRENTIFSNAVGLSIEETNGAVVTNNVIFGNESSAITSNVPATIANNTITQTAGTVIALVGAATNQQLRNNIITSETGTAISVVNSAQLGFSSDYNVIFVGTGGTAYRWGATNYSSQDAIVYQLGFESHSRFSDPKFASPNGPDGIGGFSTAIQGNAIYLDDSAAVRTGQWQTVTSANSYGGSYLTNTIGVGNDALDWTFTNLVAGQTYGLSVSVPSASLISGVLPFSIYDGTQSIDSRLLSLSSPSTAASSLTFVEAGITYRRLGYFTPTGNSLLVRLSDRGSGSNANVVVVGDSIRLQPVLADRSADNDFHLVVGSPAIDAGDTNSVWLGESHFNGNRVDVGAYGNTRYSTTSAAQTVQVVSPSGFEKFEAGQNVPIEIYSSGLAPRDATVLINVGSTTNNPILSTTGTRWVADKLRQGGAVSTVAGTINLGGISDPAPASVYQSYAFASSGVGQSLRYSLPVPDGNYQLRLHFVEPLLSVAGQRRFDIKLQGAVVQAGYDIFAASGGVRRAIAPSFAVTASQSTGLSIELVNLTSSNTAILSAIELWQVNDTGLDNPHVAADLSTDGGFTWATIAADIPLDRFGNGIFNWTIPVNQQSTQNALIRVNSQQTPSILGQSNQGFQIVPSTTTFYINDGFTDGDQYTTAVGNDANDGRSPDRPMATLSALLDLYDLDSGDVVYVDTGVYNVTSNILIGQTDAGVRIQGPTSGAALLQRGNTSSGSYVFELLDADGVIIDGLSLSGAYAGIQLSQTGDSDNVIISNNRIFNNYAQGIYVGTGNDNVLIDGNTLYGTRGSGTLVQQFDANIYVTGLNAKIQNNFAYYTGTGDSGRSIYVYGSPTLKSIVKDNRIENSKTGIEATYAEISTNTLTGNTSQAINANLSSILDNIVTGPNIGTSTGIYAGSSSIVGNIVTSNNWGIDANSSNNIERNTIQQNREFGIRASGSNYTNNLISQNAVGVVILDGPALFSNNVFDRNMSIGVLHRASTASRPSVLRNNTFYQITGAAVELNSTINYLTLMNNIFYAAGDFVIRDNLDSQSGFKSDYNLFHLDGASTKLSNWQGASIDTLSDWQYRVGEDRHSILADPKFVNAASNDYRILDSSPAIDAGDPLSAYDQEPTANGRRINLGHTGNTPSANATIGPAIHILSPVAIDKLQAGRNVTIDFRTAGFDQLVVQPRFAIQASFDDGSTWSTIVRDITVDAAGNASLQWTIPENSEAGTFTLRIFQEQNQLVSSTSPALMLAPSGRDFYINDGSIAGDSITTAVGNDANHGKTPNMPMRTLASLLAAYDLDIGDVIHIDNGTYVAIRNIRIESNDSGVIIEGPASGEAILTRDYSLRRTGSTSTPSSVVLENYLFELVGADDVTLSRLTLTGATHGVYVAEHRASNRLTIADSKIFGNYTSGVYVGYGNNEPLIEGSTFYGIPGGDNRDQQYYGIYSQTDGLTVQNNVLRNHSDTAIRIVPLNSTNILNNRLFDNDVFGNRVGLDLNGTSNSSIQAIGNFVHDNQSTGIAANTGSSISGNYIYGQTTANSVGLRVSGARDISNNAIYDNLTGVSGSSTSGTFFNNRIFSNSIVGVLATGAWQITSNSMFSNSIALQLATAYSGEVKNNVIYANSNIGVLVNSTSSSTRSVLLNNTIYHAVGNAVQISSASRNTTLTNNIIQTQSGNLVSVAADSQTGFIANYNLLNPGTASAIVGTWGGSSLMTLAQWQTITSQDTNSLSSNPQWIDIDGADNVLGDDPSSGTIRSGQNDDWFRLAKNSPAIDRGFGTTRTDRVGNSNWDDPGVTNFVGTIDIGAYEFMGNSLDTSLSKIIDVVPVEINQQGISYSSINTIDIVLSKPIAGQYLNFADPFEVRSSGANGQFGDEDDQLSIINATYLSNTNTIRLSLLNSIGTGHYRLTMNPVRNGYLRDLSGQLLDGDNDGMAGGSFIRQFDVITNAMPWFSSTLEMNSIDEDTPSAANVGTGVRELIASKFIDTDGPNQGVALSSVDDSFGLWEFSTDSGQTWKSIAETLIDGKVLLLSDGLTNRLRFQPQADVFGTFGTIVVQPWDQADRSPSGLSVLPNAVIANSIGGQKQSLSIIVQPVNDAPIVQIASPVLMLDEDFAPQEWTSWLQSISAGPGEQESLSFVIDSIDDSSLFDSLPTVSASGSIHLVSKSNRSGTSVIVLRAYDGERYSQNATVTVMVNAVNDTPTEILLSNTSLNENTSVGTVVGAFTTNDVDEGDSFTYSFVDGEGSDDNSHFTIAGNELRINERSDFEIKSTYTIRIRTVDSVGAKLERTFQINVNDLPEVESVLINNGAAQRSNVRTLKVIFDHMVNFDGPVENAFEVRKRGTEGGAVTIEAFVSNDPASRKTYVTLAFKGSFVESSGSLVDGNYDLIIRSERIIVVDTTTQIDGDRDGVSGGNFRFGSDANDQASAADAFFRLYGDSDGNGIVDNGDLGRFNQAYRKRFGEIGYDESFDFQNDGIVDNKDLGNFNLRYRKRISFQ